MTAPGPRGRHGLHEVLTSAGAVVGGGRAGLVDTLGLPAAARYVVLLVDGMGEELLREHAHLAPFLSSLPSVPDVVCGVPSTTVTSLTSLGTGLRAGAHGVVGYTSRVPETGRRLNALAWDQDVDALQWQRHPTVLQRLHEAGVNAGSVNEARFEGTGLTLCSQRGAPFHGVSSIWERLDVVAEVVEDAASSVVYAYESRLDHAGHAHGCTSQEWRDVLTTVDRETGQLRDLLPPDTVLLVTADHGMLDLPAEGRFDVSTTPALLEGVDLLAGEARFRHLYTARHDREAVAARWRDFCGERADVRTRDELDDWFGPIDPAVAGRIGDVVIAALGDFAVFSTDDFPHEMRMKGFHGSVSEAELRVPVLLAT
ncbi:MULTISPECIES: alkaline phosphatase family protein [unclassified Aeromicrobium]|uniref:alkaline phosphatase family protein n=1 Tax=unclassified Aeromicrobium TaxID=2633570 RepID=UPI002889490D|nr:MULTISPECIES: alkaline phosphatase family protein [unclassified Aeromicrobium]